MHRIATVSFLRTSVATRFVAEELIAMEPARVIQISILIVVGFASISLAVHPPNYSGGHEFSSPVECARPCILGAPPKTCYYHFTVEYYSTMSDACKICRNNSTTQLVETCQCIEADGYEMSGMITANRMHPGPSIQVCRHDYVIIDVANHVLGNGITIHWHGLFQKGSQYYDGVPYVTQCPIQQGTTFRYQWRAQNPGTHFWHAHSGLHKVDGLDGSIVIREPKCTEPNSHLWDFDNTDNVMFFTDVFHDSAPDHWPGNQKRARGQGPDNFLINGRGRWTDPVSGNTTNTPLAVFTVKHGYRYRYRMINACALTCPVIMSIEGHDLTVIASDGESVESAAVGSIVSLSAERYDFVVNANKRPGHYWIQLRGLGGCASRRLQQLAIVRYEKAPILVFPPRQPSYENGIKTGLVLNQLNVQCKGENRPPNVLCVSELRNAKHVPLAITKLRPDRRFYLPINFHDVPPPVAFKSGTYRKYLVAGGVETVGMVANITNALPPSPLLSQPHDISPDLMCSPGKVPSRCISGQVCECTHVIPVPFNAVIEIVLVDEAQIAGMSHPFHLHGHSFYVIGQGCAPEYNITSIDVDTVMELDDLGKFSRHLSNPPAKDTYAVPNNGYTIIRFIANNPGYWLFHCHFLYHLASGMVLVFHVEGPVPPVPPGFPKCGNFLPPITY